MPTDERPREATSLWAGLAVGLSVASVLGITGILIYLFTRRREQPALQPAAQPAPLHGGFDWGQPALAAPAPQLALPAPPDGMGDWGSNGWSFNLPAPGEDPVEVISASTRPIKAEVRCLGPAGSFAVLSFNVSDLVPGTPALPFGRTIIVPSGQSEPIRVKRNQTVYGRGSVGGVIVSVNAVQR